MHLLRSTTLLRAYRIASVLICLKFLLFAGAFGTLVYSVVRIDWQAMLVAFGLVGAAGFAGLNRAIFTGFVRCPLCMGPVFSPFGAKPHRKARKLLGSYRLRIALSILFRKWFHCPYCNEPTAMKLRHSESKVVWQTPPNRSTLQQPSHRESSHHHRTTNVEQDFSSLDGEE